MLTMGLGITNIITLGLITIQGSKSQDVIDVLTSPPAKISFVPVEDTEIAFEDIELI